VVSGEAPHDLLNRLRDFQRDTTDPLPTDLYLAIWHALADKEAGLLAAREVSE
jgi:hypothetical protein